MVEKIPNVQDSEFRISAEGILLAEFSSGENAVRIQEIHELTGGGQIPEDKLRRFQIASRVKEEITKHKFSYGQTTASEIISLLDLTKHF